MSKYQDIFNWLFQCPAFSNLWMLSAEQEDGCNVVVPFSTSGRRNIRDYMDTTGWYNADIIPTPSVYEEYQIHCYRNVFPNENQNAFLTLDDVQSICDWIVEQDEKGNLPQIHGKEVVSVEPFPFNPQVAGRDVETNSWKWYFTIRITYVNTSQARHIEI